MAISRGSGTEIIRSAHFQSVDSTVQKLIVGVQHHIYTVLSIIVFADSLQAAGNHVRVRFNGYDSRAGSTNAGFDLFQQDMQAKDTFVWNDKFSFNGFEPTNFTGPLDDATKQDAIADQGSSVAQYLYAQTEHADDTVDYFITYIDQNNA